MSVFGSATVHCGQSGRHEIGPTSTMRFPQFSDPISATSRGISPVIGIVLMVTIVVLLAAFIGSFVMGVGDRLTPASPSVSFEYEFNDGGNGWGNSDDWVNITHAGGAEIEQGEVEVRIGGERVEGAGANWSNSIRAGDTVAITDGSTSDYATVSSIDRGDTIHIIWNRTDVGKTVILGEREVT